MKSAIFLLTALIYGFPLAAVAQKYPERPIRLVLHVAPGGGQDVVARSMSQRLSEGLGKSIVVDNRPGGGGAIGVELVAQAAPDGYTLLMMSASAVIRALTHRVNYDLVRDFAAVSQLVSQPYLLVVNPSLPVKSVAELVSFAKSNPGKLNYGSAGSGTMTHLTGELFKAATGTDMLHIPYKGMGPAYPDLIAGNIQLAFGTTVAAQPHVRAQRLRSLAVTSAQRAKAFPELPTVAESGVPGFASTQWYGVLAPAGTPRAIIERLHREIAKAVQQPEVAAHLAADGAESVGSPPQQFAAHLRAETERWAEVIKRTGIRGN